MPIEIKTTGMLFDELCTVICKCFSAQDDIKYWQDKKEESGGGIAFDSYIADASIKAQTLNKRRNELIQGIDRVLGNENTTTDKTY